MSEGPTSDPSNQYPPASDGTWQAPPPYTPPYQASAPGQPYPPTQPYQQPTQPFQQPATPYQPGQPYQPTSPYEQSPYGAAPTYQAYPPQASGWGVPPTPPKRRTGMIIGIVVAVVVVLCIGGLVAIGASDNNDKTTNGSKTATTAPKTTAPAVVSIPLGDGVALKSHLAKPPTGAKNFTIDNSTNGVETLDQFVKNSFPDSPDEKGILQTRGFEVVAENNWRGTDGVSVNTQLIQFKDADGAVSHVLGQHGAYADDTSITGTYSLPGLTDGYGYERPALDKYGNRTAILSAPIGNIVIVMFIFTPGQLDRASEEADMQRQVAALTP